MGYTSPKGGQHEYSGKTKLGKNIKGAACSKEYDREGCGCKNRHRNQHLRQYRKWKNQKSGTSDIKKIAEALDMDLIYLTNLIGKQDEETGL